MPPFPGTKADLLKELEQANREMDQVLNDLRPEQMREKRDQEGWSIQDHLNHLAAWQEGTAAMLEHHSRYEAMGVDPATASKTSEDEQNAIIRERTPKRSIAETLAALRGSYEHLLRSLSPLEDANLFRPYSDYQPDEPGEERGEPVIGPIVNNSSRHYREHIPWIEAIAGQS